MKGEWDGKRRTFGSPLPFDPFQIYFRSISDPKNPASPAARHSMVYNGEYCYQMSMKAVSV